ncbi:MAG: AraC family transcriptional regulator [Phycisphaerae bacterium]
MDSGDKNQWQGWWRPSKAPSVSIPFGVRSVGYAEIQPGWVHATGAIYWTNLYWGISGEVGLVVNSKRCLLPANHLVIHPPETRIEGYPNEKAGAYRWLTLDGLLAGNIIKAFGFVSFEPRYVGRCPVELFDQLKKEIKDGSTAGEYRAGTTAYEILTLGAWGQRLEPMPDKSQQLIAQCLRLIQDQYHQPELTVDRLAREFRIHRSVLTRLFSRSVGLPLSRYIHSLRIRRALSLLKDQHKTIRQIAFACGFSDPAYFSRCLSKEMGINPKQIRKKLT